MTTAFILRLDDITPGMAWSKFRPVEELALECRIPLLLGVVPNCQDPTLFLEPVRENFWTQIRNWKNHGWTISQHGYTHQYVTSDRGILAIGKKSEFAGLPYEEQYAKLKAGKDILVQQGVWQPVFMAPSHSFDRNTLRALSHLGFRYLTDGYGCYPYRMDGLTAVPQLFASPKHFGLGLYTICLHVNTMTPASLEKLVRFVKAHRAQFTSFEEAATRRCPIPGLSATTRFFSSFALRALRS